MKLNWGINGISLVHSISFALFIWVFILRSLLFLNCVYFSESLLIKKSVCWSFVEVRVVRSWVHLSCCLFSTLDSIATFRSKHGSWSFLVSDETEGEATRDFSMGSFLGLWMIIVGSIEEGRHFGGIWSIWIHSSGIPVARGQLRSNGHQSNIILTLWR